MLFETFARLVKDFPDGCVDIFGQELAANGSCWLCVDGDAYPSLLFVARRDDARSDIELRSVSVHFSRDCIIETSDGTETSGVFTVVRLNENDPDVVRLLLRLLEELFPERGQPYSSKDVAGRILDLARLFKQIGDATGDILGLWGELQVLSTSSDLDNAIRCWCSHRKAKYDFVSQNYALEVKTTVKNKRKHRFSLEQLRPNEDFRVYVVSLSVVEINSGSTVAELMEEVCGNISDDDLRSQFITQCLVKGGQDTFRTSRRFGLLPDGTSIFAFDASVIPVPQIALDDPIENVRFDVDLTELDALSNSATHEILAFRET